MVHKDDTASKIMRFITNWETWICAANNELIDNLIVTIHDIIISMKFRKPNVYKISSTSEKFQVRHSITISVSNWNMKRPIPFYQPCIYGGITFWYIYIYIFQTYFTLEMDNILRNIYPIIFE